MKDDRITAGELASTAITGLVFMVALPYHRPPDGLTGNTRAHWRTKAADTASVRRNVTYLARQSGLHQLDNVGHVTVELVWGPGDRRRRDADNLWPMLKVCCDALARGRGDWVGLDLVPDDTPEYMTKLPPRIDPPPATGMWLRVTIAEKVS